MIKRKKGSGWNIAIRNSQQFHQSISVRDFSVVLPVSCDMEHLHEKAIRNYLKLFHLVLPPDALITLET